MKLAFLFAVMIACAAAVEYDLTMINELSEGVNSMVEEQKDQIYDDIAQCIADLTKVETDVNGLIEDI